MPNKHLDVKVSVCRRQGAAGPAVAVSAVVHIHKLPGRVYMLAVVPVSGLELRMTARN